ncbi:hypothetical protein BXZ70DRAFT_753932 [Cristinia sonorae]|uniref:Uncharacterized protein n=1 Tax=Cristinia sonorae TaxID=1940300 RepID=A0A8K0UUH5_9AGAR|nr:hypothetical protein BXZ70DRAFT_753932 [Cristinia sonorae]
MENVRTALESLRTSMSRKRGKIKKTFVEALGRIESHFDVLDSASISLVESQRLVTHFRHTLPSVYPISPQPALEFTAALAEFLYNDRILHSYTSGMKDQKAWWEAVLHALLSGVMDYHDEHEEEESKIMIASALYETICAMAFSLSMPFMSVALRCTAYSLLADTASGSSVNQRSLRDAPYAGGGKLGVHFWRTKDYLVLEALLTLFARILPTTEKTAAGREARTRFLRSVFISSLTDEKHKKTAHDIVKLLENLRSSVWEPTAAKIMKILANSDISYPQPFEVKHVVIQDKQKPVDLLYADNTGFCANIVIEDDQYESLDIPYHTVQKIDLLRLEKDVQIRAFLSSMPLFGSQPALSQQSDEVVLIQFRLSKDDLLKFFEAMRARKIGKLLKAHPKSSLSLAAANLELDSAGRLLGKDERYKTVSKCTCLQFPKAGV